MDDTLSYMLLMLTGFVGGWFGYHSTIGKKHNDRRRPNEAASTLPALRQDRRESPPEKPRKTGDAPEGNRAVSVPLAEASPTDICPQERESAR